MIKKVKKAVAATKRRAAAKAAPARKPKPEPTAIYGLLDGSGSMSSRWGETLASLNSYVHDLNKSKVPAVVTIAVFDSEQHLRFDIVRQPTPAADWVDLTTYDARPRGFTPLYDAVGKITSLMGADNPKKAVLVILTDGAENSSREIDRVKAKALLDDVRARGWQVVFIGADFDAMHQSAQLGVGYGQMVNMTRGNYGATTQSLSRGTQAYASFGTAMSFSDEDRAKAQGTVANDNSKPRSRAA